MVQLFDNYSTTATGSGYRLLDQEGETSNSKTNDSTGGAMKKRGGGARGRGKGRGGKATLSSRTKRLSLTKEDLEEALSNTLAKFQVRAMSHDLDPSRLHRRPLPIPEAIRPQESKESIGK